MRTAFHDQLNALTQSIADMCDLTGTAMERATRALLEVDIIAAEAVISDHENLVVREAQAESDAFALLALQAPVAGDLRAVFGSMQNVADIERMGALLRCMSRKSPAADTRHTLSPRT